MSFHHQYAVNVSQTTHRIYFQVTNTPLQWPFHHQSMIHVSQSIRHIFSTNRINPNPNSASNQSTMNMSFIYSEGHENTAASAVPSSVYRAYRYTPYKGNVNPIPGVFSSLVWMHPKLNIPSFHYQSAMDMLQTAQISHSSGQTWNACSSLWIFCSYIWIFFGGEKKTLHAIWHYGLSWIIGYFAPLFALVLTLTHKFSHRASYW